MSGPGRFLAAIAAGVVLIAVGENISWWLAAPVGVALAAAIAAVDYRLTSKPRTAPEPIEGDDR